MDIHTQQLRHFMELAKCLNFTKAAMNLYIAQPALSQQIADLEKQLGVTLFERTSRSVSLTPAGEILKENCPKILNNIGSVHQLLLSAQAGLRGNLKIGYLEPYQIILPDIVHQYQEAYPDVAVELFNGTVRDLQNALRNQDADVIFTVLDQISFRELSTYAHRIIKKEGLSLIIRKDHPFVTSGNQDYSLLNGEIFCLVDEESVPGTHQVVQEVCAKLGIPISKLTTCKTSGPIFIQAESGMCFSVFPTSYADLACSHHMNLAAVPIDQDCMSHCVIWNPASRNAALPLFLDVLETTLGDPAK